LETLTTKQVALILQIDEETVRVYLRKGKLKGFKVQGSNLWRVEVNELEKLAKGKGKEVWHD
jgi:excisionase family DNA binding protein